MFHLYFLKSRINEYKIFSKQKRTKYNYHLTNIFYYSNAKVWGGLKKKHFFELFIFKVNNPFLIMQK